MGHRRTLVVGMRWRGRGGGLHVGALAATIIIVAGALTPSVAHALPAEIVDIPIGADTGLGSTTPSGAVDEDAEGAQIASRQARALPDDRERAEIPDPVLRREIARKLNISSPTSLTKGDVRRLQSLTAKNVGISDLTGLELATNLEHLYVDQNSIASLEPLRDLPKMRQITASRNPISDISPLATLPNINWLELNWTEITSLEPLRGNTKLGWLQVAYTNIDSIEPLGESTNLGSLYFQNTEVSDISALSGIDDIMVISAPDAEISDLEPLRGKQKLYLLNINRNHVTDLSMLETWPEISTVGFNDQSIDGGGALVPVGATEYTRSDVVSIFSMPFGERQSVVEFAEPTEDGEGAVWSDLEEDVEHVEVFLSKPVVPNGPPFSATVNYSVARADFAPDEPEDAIRDTPYEFTFNTTPGFTDGVVSRAASAAGFRVLSGGVPGLELSPTGTLSGTPTEAGTFGISVRAADRHGNEMDRAFTLVVAEKPVKPGPPVVTPPAPEPPTTDPSSPAPESPNKGVLSSTGAALPLALGAVALLLGLSGALLIVRSRRLSAGH